MDLDGERAVIHGTQSYNGESPTSDDVFQHVKGCKEKGRTWWWQCVGVVLVSLKGNSEVICQLQCKCCDTFLQPLQPLQCLQDTLEEQELQREYIECEKWAHSCGGAVSSSRSRP